MARLRSSAALKVQLGWNDYEDVKTGATEGNNIITGVGYEYPLSKRTYLYTAAGYTGQDRKGRRRNEGQNVRSHARHGPQVLITACSHRTSVWPRQAPRFRKELEVFFSGRRSTFAEFGAKNRGKSPREDP